jgi:pimeloyl-ACP methyl ester carboxylesterase
LNSVRTDDRTTLVFEERGRGKPILLFIHGWAGSRAFFRESIDALDLTRARAVTFDLRGHGDSSKPQDGFNAERLARDALAVADAVGADEFVVVGFSIGAQLAQLVSLEAPERSSGQILISGWPAAPVPLPQEMLDDWCGRAGHAERLAELFRMSVTEPSGEHVLERVGRDAAKASRAALERLLIACATASFRERLETLDTPTLVVAGNHDENMTPNVLRNGVVAPLPRARLAVLDAKHAIPLERPRELAALFEAFLAARS